MAKNNMLNPFDFFGNIQLIHAQNDEYCRQLMELNETTLQKGLILSETEVRELIDTRNQSLADNSRIELGIGVLPKIIERFSDSSFIYQSNYADTMNELIEIFYYIKTEAFDKISDDDLIEAMWEFFEHTCYGSIELMTGRELETLLKYIHGGRKDYTLESKDDYTQPYDKYIHGHIFDSDDDTDMEE